MTEDVEEAIIRPMLRLYPPPQHLRGGPELHKQALAEYRSALARFDRPTLQLAWQTVTAEHAFWCWPCPGIIADACRRCQPRPQEKSEAARREERALAMAEAYVNRYMRTSHLAKLAKAEGWAGRLLEYVHAAAWVQSQLICGCRDVGWSAALLAPSHSSSKEAFEAYQKTIEGPVARDRVRVTVPPGRVREWKEDAGRRSGGVSPP